MSEKKQSVFSKLFQNKGGCGCGVSIVEETKAPEKKSTENSKKSK
ncbi:MAG: hypothetical protein N4A76_07100 [Firmicutes bacterium]|jgi:hypothetical protein|nr:hypothetical protein [Bacillota bacterium]